MAAPEGDGARPWADLPVEMVDAMVQHLDLFSTTRLASVCTSWASAVATNAALPFGAPCLLMTSEDDDDDLDYDHEEEWSYQLMDLTCGRGVSFPALVGEMQNQWWVGAKDDWLAVVDQHGGARLLNPYSGHQIDLPRIVPATESGRAFDRIVVCETPSDAGGYLVIGMANHNFLAIARGGDVSWTALRNPEGHRRVVYEDAIVHKGKVFAVDRSGCIYSWNIRGGLCSDPKELRPPHVDCGELRFQRESSKLAESGDGRRLVLVCTYGEQVKRRRFSLHSGTYYLEFVPEGVRVYERDVDGGGDGWSPVADLGDHSLFLGANYPFFARVVDRGSSDDADQPRRLVRPNCVCFAEGQLFRRQECDVEVFDLGAVEDAYRTCKLLWSNRRYNSCYQVPIWFRPILKNYSP